MSQNRKSKRRHAPDYLAQAMQWRLLLLVLGLGLVVIAIGRLQDPDTAARWNNWFANEPAVSNSQVAQTIQQGRSQFPNDSFRSPKSIGVTESASGEVSSGVRPELLKTIEDNTHFRSKETDAWFHLLEILQKATDEEVLAESIGEVGYVQMLQQPHVYRGKLVTVRGSVRRVEELTPAENDIGLTKYYLLTLRPAGGQIWPIRVYCLELPPGLPVGDDLSEDIEVTGFFFKNWSYQWQDGMGLAPVLLARTVQLQGGVVQ